MTTKARFIRGYKRPKKITTKTVDDQQSKRIMKLEKQVRTIRKVEIKQQTDTLSATGDVFYVNAITDSITQGTGVDRRTGDSIQLKRCELTFHVKGNPYANTSFSQWVRIMVVWGSSDDAPSGSELLEGYTGLQEEVAYLQHANASVDDAYNKSKRFTILYDKMVNMNLPWFTYDSAVATDQLVSTPHTKTFKKVFKWKVGKTCNYEGNTPQDGRLWVAIFPGADSGPDPFNPEVYYGYRIFYQDS